MCGIAGIIGPRAEESELDLMLSLLHHRGPDEAGTYAAPGVAIGNVRLAIIDIEGGQQPMTHTESGATVVFNGEIFNYKELREKLEEEGFCFDTASDTEVVLKMYIRYGKEFPKHLNGQFAIAIWDPRSSELLLARDRFGICPLFYHRSGKRFVFGSEIKAIFAVEDVKREICPEAMDQIFTFWTTLPGRTIFTGVQELKPGTVMILRRDGSQSAGAYWEWQFPDTRDSLKLSFEDASEELATRIQHAIKLRLRADVEVASYLSGGVDSSALVAIGSAVQPKNFQSFSIAFDDESYDESPYQQVVANHCGTTHTEFRCSHSDIEAAFESAVWHAETPLFRTAPAPLNLLSKSVRGSGIKVVLTGEGADEVFLGYDLFREVKVRRFWRRAPESKIRPQLFKRLYGYLPQFANDRFANLAIQSFRKTLNSDSLFYSHQIRWENNSANKMCFSDELSTRLDGYECLDELEGMLPQDYHDSGDVGRAQYLELNTLLRGYLLSSQGDRMTTANSIEGRYPFLDHELIDYVSTLPTRYKLCGLKDKHVFRHSVKDMLPDSISNRPKFAYQAPELRSFFPVGEAPSLLVSEHLGVSRLKSTGLFDPNRVAGLLKKINHSTLNRLGTRDNMAIVQMLSTQILHSKFIESAPRTIAKRRLPTFKINTRIRAAADQSN